MAQPVDALVLGSSGYLGRHLAAALAACLGPARVVCVSRSVDEGPTSVRVDLSAAPLPADHRLFGLAPACVFVLARPASPDHAPNRIFHDNLQRLLLAWARMDAPSLAQLHLTSTTMVYPGTHPGPEPADSPRVAPFGMYEYFKLETELFLRYLQTAVRTDVDVRVWRLPIAFGGQIDLRAQAEAGQFLPVWIDAYRNGHAWRFDADEDAAFGTSWFDVPDFVAALAAMTRPAKGARFSIANVASGFFTYRELHDLLAASVSGPLAAGSLHLHRTRFEVADELGLPPRDIREAVSRALSVARRPESSTFMTVESTWNR